ncbi:hypothetical protein R6Q57_008583 [Mikania cordata]
MAGGGRGGVEDGEGGRCGVDSSGGRRAMDAVVADGRCPNLKMNMRAFALVNSLSEQQKKAIIDMGFKPFLSLAVDTIPTRLAHWLVSNYDYERDELNAGNHIIKVTTITVKDVLGVPFGKITVNEKNKPRIGSSDTLKTWKEQYHGKSRITVKYVLDQMKKM